MATFRDAMRKKKKNPPSLLEEPQLDPAIVPQVIDFVRMSIRARILRKVKDKRVVNFLPGGRQVAAGGSSFNIGLTGEHFASLVDELIADGYIYESNGFYSREPIAISDLEKRLLLYTKLKHDIDDLVRVSKSTRSKVQTAMEHLQELGLVYRSDEGYYRKD